MSSKIALLETIRTNMTKLYYVLTFWYLLALCKAPNISTINQVILNRIEGLLTKKLFNSSLKFYAWLYEAPIKILLYFWIVGLAIAIIKHLHRTGDMGSNSPLARYMNYNITRYIVNLYTFWWMLLRVLESIANPSQDPGSIIVFQNIPAALFFLILSLDWLHRLFTESNYIRENHV